MSDKTKIEGTVEERRAIGLQLMGHADVHVAAVGAALITELDTSYFLEQIADRLTSLVEHGIVVYEGS